MRAPPHISDGGGPQDSIREAIIQERLEQIVKSQYPQINYHPLVLPKGPSIDLDPQTSDILSATFQALNMTNPELAADCWLCMTLGTPMPIALPVTFNESALTPHSSCTANIPFRVQPLEFSNVTCLQGPARNNSFDLEVGFTNFANCSRTINFSTSLCPGKGQILVCGGNLAYSYLPTNWTGVCVVATLLPDIDIIPGDQPVPVPSLDLISGRIKRAVTLIPLLVGLGITGAVATGSAGIGVALHSYAKLSNKLIDDVESLSQSIKEVQDQLDSLAEMVLQNRRGLDLLTAEKGGICLALQEKCCVYVNKSRIVRDRIKKLQEDLIRRRKELFDSPFLSGLNGILPYLLPLLGPCIGFLCLISLGPFLFNKLMSFLRERIDSIKLMVLAQPYHRISTMEESQL
ncbi:syncytin-1-like [Saccopteryx leptura]|uniref:syncytin-1-like n=1 Tax=Saccopteryx leptura TaxID=249018 RepID=UPI00339C8767